MQQLFETLIHIDGLDSDLATTQRYLHLAPRMLDEAIRILEAPAVATAWQQGQSA